MIIVWTKKNKQNNTICFENVPWLYKADFFCIHVIKSRWNEGSKRRSKMLTSTSNAEYFLMYVNVDKYLDACDMTLVCKAQMPDQHMWFSFVCQPYHLVDQEIMLMQVAQQTKIKGCWHSTQSQFKTDSSVTTLLLLEHFKDAVWGSTWWWNQNTNSNFCFLWSRDVTMPNTWFPVTITNEFH